MGLTWGPSILTMLRTLSTRFPQGIRTMAAKAKKAPAAEVKIAAPVRLHGLDGRYASSLYCVAARKKQLETVESDLKILTGALGSSQALSELVSNPSIPKGAKVAAIEDLAKKAGFAESTNNLLALMAENNRLAELTNILTSMRSCSALLVAKSSPMSPLLMTSTRHRPRPSRSLCHPSSRRARP